MECRSGLSSQTFLEKRADVRTSDRKSGPARRQAAHPFVMRNTELYESGQWTWKSQRGSMVMLPIELGAELNVPDVSFGRTKKNVQRRLRVQGSGAASLDDKLTCLPEMSRFW